MAEIICPHCGMLNYTVSGECQNCHRPLLPPEGQASQGGEADKPHVSPFGTDDFQAQGEEPEWMRVIRQKKETEDVGSKLEPDLTDQVGGDWLAQIRETSVEKNEEEKPESAPEGDDWLNNIRNRVSEEGLETLNTPPPEDAEPSDMLDPYWLKKLHDSHKDELGQFADLTGIPDEESLPDWLAGPAHPESSDSLPSTGSDAESTPVEEKNSPADADQMGAYGDAYYKKTTALHPLKDQTPEKEENIPVVHQEQGNGTNPPMEEIPSGGFKAETAGGESSDTNDQQNQAKPEIQPNRSLIGSGLTNYLDPFWLKKLEETHGNPLEGAEPSADNQPEIPARTTYLDPNAVKQPAEPEPEEPIPSEDHPEAEQAPVPFAGVDAGENPPGELFQSQPQDEQGNIVQPVESAGEEISGEPVSSSESLSTDQTGPVTESNPPVEATPGDSQDWLADFRAKSNLTIGQEGSGESTEPLNLSDQSSGEPKKESLPSGEGEEPEILPGEIPGWVQALRPVEDAAPFVVPDADTNRQFEDQGPLAGIQGILPSEPVGEKYEQPLVFSAGLNLTEKQSAQVELFRNLLAARGIPQKIIHEQKQPYPQAIRWIVSIILLLAVAVIIISGKGAFGSPAYYPQESVAAFQILKDLPSDSRVLIAVDYAPAYTGEIESAILPALKLLNQKGAQMAFISTSPSGPALSEKLITSITQTAGNGSQPAQQISNFGYVPGGPAALLSLARDLRGTVPYLIDGQPAWQTTGLVNIQKLSDFGVILVLTDNAESARTWAEQVLPISSPMKIIVGTSAQAAPFIRPYYESGQINGLIAGLQGGMTLEKLTGTIITAGLYWDSYQAGILITIILIVAGILLNYIFRHLFQSGSRKKV